MNHYIIKQNTEDFFLEHIVLTHLILRVRYPLKECLLP